MKIAIPTRGNMVDDHFGHCEKYTIFSASAGAQEEPEILMAPQGCGCKSNIASILAEKGVKTMLAGNMGQGAVQKISAAGINVIRGCKGEVRQLVKDYLEGKINDSGETCNHHQHGHSHGHGHSCER